MIRLVILDEIAPLVVEQICRRLFMAYGVGCSQEGHRDAPREARVADGYDALRLLQLAPDVGAYADDKVLYLVASPLQVPEGPLGIPPSEGFALPKTGVAVVSSHGLEPPAGNPEAGDRKLWDGFADRIARRAVQQLGFLWGLHRCVDPRCAMYVPWPSAALKAGVEAHVTLCDFCRTRSETALQRTRS